jgi:acyl-CoA thioester hydrolase
MTNADEIPSREDYKHFLNIPTRWMDNDIYGHVNNVVYYSYFDTVINKYLIEQGGMDISKDSVVGIAVETHCRFMHSLQFPDSIDAGLRVGHLGNSSVRYEIGLFKQGDAAASAAGYFVHVFVDRSSQKPVPIPHGIRAALEHLAA